MTSMGIEQILARAAADPAFAVALCEDRDGAVQQSGVNLTPTERRVLASLSDARLTQLVSGRVRRVLLGGAAAALLGVAAGCEGSRAEIVEHRQRVAGYGGGIGGIRPGTGSFGRPVTPHVRVRQKRIAVQGKLDRQIVRRIVRRHLNELRRCYEDKEPERRPVELTLAFSVNGQGKVALAAVKRTSLENKKLDGCLEGAARRWLFPAPKDGRAVQVEQELSFEHVDPSKKKPGKDGKPER